MYRTFEHHRDPAGQLLNAWSTDHLTLRQLIDCLQSAGLLREVSLIRDLVESPQTTEPTSLAADQSHDRLQIPYAWLTDWTRNFNEISVHGGGCLLGQGGYADVFKGL